MQPMQRSPPCPSVPWVGHAGTNQSSYENRLNGYSLSAPSIGIVLRSYTPVNTKLYPRVGGRPSPLTYPVLSCPSSRLAVSPPSVQSPTRRRRE
jgi:hypothetical protein